MGDAPFVELVAKAGSMDENARRSFYSITGRHLPTTLLVQNDVESDSENIRAPSTESCFYDIAPRPKPPKVEEVPLVFKDIVFKDGTPCFVPGSFGELILGAEGDVYNNDWSLPWENEDDENASSSPSSDTQVVAVEKQDTTHPFASATEVPEVSIFELGQAPFPQTPTPTVAGISTSTPQATTAVVEFDASLDEKGKTREDGMQSVFQRTVYKYDHYQGKYGKSPSPGHGRPREQTPLKKALTMDDLARGDQ